nr:hypothetical protein [Mycobacterium aquaticum]
MNPTARPMATPVITPKTNRRPAFHERERTGDGGRDRDAIGDQCGGIVEQPLALDAADQPSRCIKTLHDRRCGDWVGGRHDGAQHERRRPSHSGNQRVRGPRDAGHRDEDQHHGAQCQITKVGPEVAEVGVDRRLVQQRRQEQREDEVGFELDLRQPGDESEGRAADHQHDGIRHREPACQRPQCRDGQQQSGDQHLNMVHVMQHRAREEPATLRSPKYHAPCDGPSPAGDVNLGSDGRGLHEGDDE